MDDYDIRAINLRHLREHIGIVTQEPVLFNCSIKDNIAYGVNNREVTMDEIIDVAKKANIHNFITTLTQVNISKQYKFEYNFNICFRDMIHWLGIVEVNCLAVKNNA